MLERSGTAPPPTRPPTRSTRTLLLLALPLLAPAAPAVALPGELDPSFDGDGEKILANTGLDLGQATRC
jgi:hypothetical protein